MTITRFRRVKADATMLLRGESSLWHFAVAGNNVSIIMNFSRGKKSVPTCILANMISMIEKYSVPPYIRPAPSRVKSLVSIVAIEMQQSYATLITADVDRNPPWKQVSAM